MTKGKLAIQHPKPNCKGNFFQRLLCWLFGMRKKETIRCSSFAAYGCFVGDPGDITGRVTSSDGTKHYDQKKTFKQGNLWALLFEVPMGKKYSLKVSGTNAHEVPRVTFDVQNYEAIGIAYRRVGGQRGAEPEARSFSNHPPPNRTCTFQRIRLSSNPSSYRWSVVPTMGDILVTLMANHKRFPLSG